MQTGVAHTCAERAIWCWGSNSAGQAGQEAADVIDDPTPSADITRSRVLVTGWYTTLAIQQDGRQSWAGGCLVRRCCSCGLQES